MKSAVPSYFARARYIKRCRGLIALLLFGHSLTSHATDIHWANPVNGNWNTAANWNPAQVPGAGDRAFITVDGTYTVAVSAVTTVGGLEVGGATGTQTFTNSQNFILNGPGNVGVNGVWGVGVGGVAGTSEVTVNGRFVWNGGTLNRTGTVTIATGGSLLLAGASRVFTSGRLLLQAGAVGNWASGAMSSGTGSGAILENEGTLDIEGDLAWNTSGTVPPRFINRGLVRKTAGTAAVARLAGLFENGVGGHLHVQAGTMEIHGNSVGRFTLDADTTLTIASGGTSQNIFGNGTVFEGPGLLSIPGGVTRLEPGASFAGPPPALRVQTGEIQLNSGQPLNAQALTLISGRLSGSDTVTVTDLTTWQTGELAVGLTVVAAGGVDLIGAVARTFNGTLRLPAGTVSNWRAGSINSTAVAHLENFGTMNMLGDMDWTANFNNPPNLLNQGRWSKAGGTLESSLAVIVNNGSEGVLQVSSGTLSLAHGGFSDGILNVDAGGTLQFSANGFVFVLAPNGRLRGLGRCRLWLGNLDLQSGSDLAGFQGTFEIAGGTCQMNSTSLLAVDSLILSGGTLTGVQRIAVTGPTVWRASAIAGSPIIEARGGLYLTNNSIRSFQGGTLFNYGLARWTNGTIASSVGSAVFSNAFGAQFEIGGPANLSWTIGAGGSANLINSGTVTVQTQPNRRLTLNVPFENRGEVFLQNSDVLMDVPGAYRQTAGRTVLAGATFRPFNIPLQLDGGELSGSGAILSTVNNNAHVIATELAAPLTITGSYLQSSQGVLDIDWAGPGVAFAPLQISGTARLDGTLRVNLANGYTPAQGDVRTILTAGTRIGTFAQLNLITTARVAALYSLNSATLEVLPGSFTVNPVAPRSGIEGDPLRVQLGVTPQLPVGALSYAFANSPVPNATLDPTTGEFTWSPTEEQGPGEYDFTVRVRDSAVPPVSADVTFHVSVLESNRPPVLQTATIPSVLEGTSLNFTLNAADPDLPANPLTYALVSNGGATGLAVSPEGILQWTPGLDKGPGIYTAQVSVTDSSPDAINMTALTDTKPFIVRVDGVNTPPVIDAIPFQVIAPGVPWSLPIPAHDNDLPPDSLVFTLLEGPYGMSVGSGGTLFWTPGFDLIGQTFAVRVRVRDSGAGVPANALTAEASFSVRVDRAGLGNPNAPWVAQDVDAIGDVGASAVIRMDASGQIHLGYFAFVPGATGTELEVRVAHEYGTGFSIERIWSLPLTPALPTLGSQIAPILRAHGAQQLDYQKAPDGTEHVVFVEPAGIVGFLEIDNRIRYGRRRPGGAWEFQVLASAWNDAVPGVFDLQAVGDLVSGIPVALSVDAGGLPRLVFVASARVAPPEISFNQGYYYAERAANDTWTLVRLPGDPRRPAVAANIALATDRQNLPHIGLWAGSPEGNVRVEHHSRTATGVWTTSVVQDNLYPATGELGLHLAMVLDPADQVHLAYPNPNLHGIEYARPQGATWQTEFVAEGHRPALVLLNDGRPTVAFEKTVITSGSALGQEGYARQWLFTRRTGNLWSRPEPLYPPQSAARPTAHPAVSMLVDAHDTLFVALDTGPFRNDLVYVRSQDTNVWRKQTLAAAPPGGLYAEPFLVADAAGQFHVSATLIEPDRTRPVVFRTSPADGSWIPATFDAPFSDRSRGYATSLAVGSDQRVAISFFGGENGLASQVGKIWLGEASAANPDQFVVTGPIQQRCHLGNCDERWCLPQSLIRFDDALSASPQIYLLESESSQGKFGSAVAQGIFLPYPRDSSYLDRSPGGLVQFLAPPGSSTDRGLIHCLVGTSGGLEFFEDVYGRRSADSGAITESGTIVGPSHLSWDTARDVPVATYAVETESGAQIRLRRDPLSTPIRSDNPEELIWNNLPADPPVSTVAQVQADYRMGSSVILYIANANADGHGELRMLMGRNASLQEAPSDQRWIESSAGLGELISRFSFTVAKGRWHLAYINDQGALRYASRVPSTDGPPVNFAGTAPCGCTLDTSTNNPTNQQRQDECGWLSFLVEFVRILLLGRQGGAGGAVFPKDAPPPPPMNFAPAAVAALVPPTDELTVLRRLRDRLIQSPEGARLLLLYAEHNRETRSLGLRDLHLATEALSAIQNFLPGFDAWLNDRGATVTISADMIQQVTSVWNRLATRGSPELRAAILGELARHNSLQDFIGLTLDQWAEAMGFNERFIAIVRTERLGGGVRLTVNHLEGRAYTLLRSPTLETPAWTPVANVTEEITGYVRLLTDPSPGNSQVFYRVVAAP